MRRQNRKICRGVLPGLTFWRNGNERNHPLNRRHASGRRSMTGPLDPAPIGDIGALPSNRRASRWPLVGWFISSAAMGVPQAAGLAVLAGRVEHHRRHQRRRRR